VPDSADIAATLTDPADKSVISLRSTSVFHHDGVLGIGVKDVPSFELGLNPNPGAGTVGSPAAAEVAVAFRLARWRTMRIQDAEGERLDDSAPVV